MAQVLGLLLSVASTAVTARWLGPAGKGTLALALLIPGMLGLFLNGGIGAANVYFVGSRRLDVPSLTANSVWFGILATILGASTIAGFAVTGWLRALLPGVPLWLILMAMVGLPISVLNGYFTSILQGLQRFVLVNLLTVAQGALSLVLILVLIVGFRIGLVGALLGSLGSGAATLMATSFLLHREGDVFVPRWKTSVVRATLSYGLKGYVGNMLQFFNYRLDTFIVNYFVGAAGVGIYGVAVTLAELLWYLPNAVGFVIFPKAAATRPEEMNAFTPRVFRVLLLLTTVGAIGMALVSKPLINIVYTSAFASAYVPMLALLPGVVLLGSAKALTNEIAGRGYPHYNSINSGLALVMTVILDLRLIPQYGILGAAIASSVSYAATFLAAICFYLIVSRRAQESHSLPASVP